MVEGVAIKGEIVKRDIKDMPPGRRGPSPSREFRVRESQDTEQLILLQQVFQQGHNKVQNLQGKYMKNTEKQKHLLSTHMNFLTIDWASRRHSLLQVLGYLSLILIINHDI